MKFFSKSHDLVKRLGIGGEHRIDDVILQPQNFNNKEIVVKSIFNMQI